jgi:hypothetical protein
MMGEGVAGDAFLAGTAQFQDGLQIIVHGLGAVWPVASRWH